MPVYSQQGLAAVMPALMSNHAPAALQAAAQAGDPGFASALAHLLQQSFPLHQVCLLCSALQPHNQALQHRLSSCQNMYKAVKQSQSAQLLILMLIAR